MPEKPSSKTLESQLSHCQQLLEAEHFTAALEAAAALSLGFAEHQLARAVVAEARLVQAQALAGLEQFAAALEIYDCLQAECMDAEDSDLNAVGAHALMFAAFLHERLGDKSLGFSKLTTLLNHVFVIENLELRRLQAWAGAVLARWQLVALEEDDPEDEDWFAAGFTGEAFEKVLLTCELVQSRYGDASDARLLMHVNICIGVQLETLALQGLSACTARADQLAARQWALYAHHPSTSVQNQVFVAQLERTIYLAPALELLEYQRLLAHFGGSQAGPLQVTLARTYYSQARAMLVVEPQQTAQILGLLGTLETRFGGASDEAVQHQVAVARLLIVRVLRGAGRWREALTVLETQAHSGNFEQLSARQAAVDALETQAEIWGDQWPPALINSTAKTLEPAFFEAETEGLHVVKRLLERFGTDDNAGIRSLVALRLYNTAVDLRERRHFAAAIELYQSYLHAFASDEAIPAAKTASTHLNMAFLLLELEDFGSALKTYDALLARLVDATTSETRNTRSRAVASRVTCINRMQRAGIEVSFGAEFEELSVLERDQIWDAIDRARLLSADGHHLEAIAIYDSVLDQHAASPHPELRRSCSDALTRKAYSLARLGQPQAAIAANQLHVTVYGDDLSQSIQKDVALALSNTAVELNKLGRHTAEIAIYDQIVLRYSSNELAYLRERVAKALYAKGLTLCSDQAGLAGDVTAGLAVYAALIDRFLHDELAVVRLQAAQALVSTGLKLRSLQRDQEAITAYQRLLEVCDTDSDPEIRSQCVRARVGLARAYGELGQPDQQIEIFKYLLALPEKELVIETHASLRSALSRLEPARTVAQQVTRWWNRKRP